MNYRFSDPVNHAEGPTQRGVRIDLNLRERWPRAEQRSPADLGEPALSEHVVRFVESLGKAPLNDDRLVAAAKLFERTAFETVRFP